MISEPSLYLCIMWLILIDADQYWSILIDADWFWLILIDILVDILIDTLIDSDRYSKLHMKIIRGSTNMYTQTCCFMYPMHLPAFSCTSDAAAAATNPFFNRFANLVFAAAANCSSFASTKNSLLSACASWLATTCAWLWNREDRHTQLVLTVLVYSNIK